MKGKQIKNCGKYAMVRCVVGSNGTFNEGDILDVGEDTDGVYVMFAGEIKVYESPSRFVEYPEEVQLAEPHGINMHEVPLIGEDVLDHARANSPLTASDGSSYASDDIAAYEDMEKLQESTGGKITYGDFVLIQFKLIPNIRHKEIVISSSTYIRRR